MEHKEVEIDQDSERFFKEEKPEASRDDTRGGATYNTLASFLRGIKELAFSNGFIFRNRPGRRVDTSPTSQLATGLVNVKNMFEMFYKSRSDVGINGITIGREGDGKFSNTHLIQLQADHSTALASKQGINNGAIKLRTGRDGVVESSDRTGILIADVNTMGTTLSDKNGVVVQVVGTGTNGGVVISWVKNRGDDPNSGNQPRIGVFNDGVYLLHLPTSSSGLSKGALWNNSGVVNIV